jgi:pyrroloquinoline quinone biosynthesis protein D
MSAPPMPISEQSRPRLALGVRLAESPAHGGWVLLAPERVFQTDAIAVEILRLCDGARTFQTIVDDLTARFAAPREEIATDVAELLTRLVGQRLVDV